MFAQGVDVRARDFVRAPGRPASSHPERSLPERSTVSTLWRIRMSAYKRSSEWIAGTMAIGRLLLGAEHTVAGVPKAGQNVTVAVQLLVHCRGNQGDIRVSLMEGPDAFRGRQQAGELELLHAVVF